MFGLRCLPGKITILHMFAVLHKDVSEIIIAVISNPPLILVFSTYRILSFLHSSQKAQTR